jgi:hypothetical protein
LNRRFAVFVCENLFDGNYVGVVIHLFHTVLALLLVIAAGIAAYDTVVRDFTSTLATE